jgi:hypothetical protein
VLSPFLALKLRDAFVILPPFAVGGIEDLGERHEPPAVIDRNCRDAFERAQGAIWRGKKKEC